MSAGVLALWTDGPTGGSLEIVGAFDPAGSLPDLVGATVTTGCFPPEPLIAAAVPAGGRMCVVVPVRTADRDWGLLAVVGEIERTSARETYQHWAALLCASLESQRLQHEVRRSEGRYALAARATREGHWELDVRARTLYLSDRCCGLLGIEPDPRADRFAEGEALIHPDDLAAVRHQMRPEAMGEDESVDSEFRVRTVDGIDRWMLACAVGLWNRSRTPFVVLLLDLDGFKAVNDSLGHPIGDRLLSVVGTRLVRELRAVDTGARFGGDEFAILLHDAGPDDDPLVAERIQAGLAELIEIDGHEITIQASMGIATGAIGYTSAEDILRDADTAMYHAKALGWGTVTFFDADMHAHAVYPQRLQTQIYRALEDEQFEVYYQPIVDLGTGRADRFEALVRWNHPGRGLVMPDEFLPLMEETGLVIPLG